MDLVETLVAVVEEEGMTAAARRLRIPKSTVSRRVQRLEDELGIRLVERSTRRSRLTEAGQRFYNSVAPAVDQIRRARETARNEDEVPKGRVRMTAPEDLASTLLPRLLAEFHCDYPEVEVWVDSSNRVVDLVAEGFDLALRAGRLPDSALIARRIADGELWIVAPTSLVSDQTLTLKDLGSLPAVLFRGSDRWELEGPDGIARVSVQGKVSGTDFRFVARCVEFGLGIALLPSLHAQRLINAGRALRILPDYSHTSGSLYLVTPSKMFPARVRVLRDYLIRALPDVSPSAR
ncbi:MAG: LysR family transcriptional regulator [Myxococcota bacterium]